MIISLAVFLVIIIGLGSIARIAGWSKEDALEKFFITSGIGLLAIPVVGVIFNLLGIPIDFKNFIYLALTILIFSVIIELIRKSSRSSIKNLIKELISLPNIALLVIFGIALYMYLKGSFSYEWFEDYDPWLYAASTKFIALEKTFNSSFWSRVSQPYPQGFQIILAILHQTNSSLSWTMKFFNAIIVSLSYPMFYYLSKKLVPGKWPSIIGTAALLSMPAWLTHFIFPFSLSMTSIPIFFYALIKSEENNKWFTIALISFISIWFIHFYSSFVITIMLFLYWLNKSFCENKFNKSIIWLTISGMVVSLSIFWLPSLYKFKDEILIDQKVPAGLHVFINPIKSLIETGYWINVLSFILFFIIIISTQKFWRRALSRITSKFNFKYTKATIFTIAISLTMVVLLWPKKFMRVLGSGSMPYTLEHFLSLNTERNLIQNPFGIGAVSMALAAVGFIYCIVIIAKLFSKEKQFTALIFVWSIFTFLGVSSARFSLNLMPFRMWSFFAFSVALLVALCYNLITNKIKQPILKICLTVLLIIGFSFTWFPIKYKLNSNRWKEGWLTTIQAINLYVWVGENLPKNSKVYSLGTNQCVPIVFDMISYPWDYEVKNYINKDIENSPSDNYEFLKAKGYEYVIVDVSSSLYHFNYTHYELPEGVKNVLFIKNLKLLNFKKAIMRQMDNKFELIKEFGDTGAIFKIL